MSRTTAKQVHPVENIGISPWPVDVVEFGADVKQLYDQVPQTAWVGWSQFEAVPVQFQSQLKSVGDKMPNWEPAPDRGLGPSVTHGWAAQPRRGRYGREKNFGSICSSLSPSPSHLSHITNINPFATLSRIKCERYIFIKKCVRSFVEVLHYVSIYICMYMSIQHKSLSISLKTEIYYHS